MIYNRQSLTPMGFQHSPGDILLFQTEGASFAAGFNAVGDPNITWYWSDGTTTTGNTCNKTFGSIATRKHYLTVAHPELITMILWSSKLLSGVLSPKFGAFISAFFLLFNTNQFVGPLPDELGNMAGAQYLFLYDNNLTGKIPESLQNLNALKACHFHNNNFGVNDLSDGVNTLWLNRVQLGANACSIKLEGNNGLTADAVAQIEGTSPYAGDGLKTYGCTVTY